MVRLLLFFLFLFQTVFADDCTSLVENLSKIYPREHYAYAGEAAWDATLMSRQLVLQNPQLSSYPLSKLLEFALENAAGHGDAGEGSRVVAMVSETPDGFIRVSIRNKFIHELPPQLMNTVFTPRSEIIEIPKSQRDTARGIRGLGLPTMISNLKEVVRKDWPVTGEPTLQWNILESPTGKEVELEIRLPKSTRVLIPRKSKK